MIQLFVIGLCFSLSSALTLSYAQDMFAKSGTPQNHPASVAQVNRALNELELRTPEGITILTSFDDIPVFTFQWPEKEYARIRISKVDPSSLSNGAWGTVRLDGQHRPTRLVLIETR